MHEGDCVSGATNSGVCVSPTTPRGARNLPCNMSRASNANENLAQCGDNAGRIINPIKIRFPMLLCQIKVTMNACPNDQHDILISENMASNVKSLSFLHWK